MIQKIKHKGLRNFFEKDQAKGINPDWINRIQRILTLLDAASEPAGMEVPGMHLHPLKGDFEGFWSVRVTGNWRIIWRIIWRFDEAGHATDVDLTDYH